MAMRRRKRNPVVKVGIFCLSLILALGLLNVSYALWYQTLDIQGSVTMGQWDEGGTIGFWKNWDNPNHLAEEDIVEWLAGINPGWFDSPPTTAQGMVDIINDGLGEGHTKKEHFLAQYLATSLNLASGRLNGTTIHNFIGYDPANYLGIGGSGTVPEIIAAIEDILINPPPNDDHNDYNIMMSICDALNNLAI